MSSSTNLKLLVQATPLRLPRICLLTCYLPNYEAIAEKTVAQNKAEYAKRWGHDLLALFDVSPKYTDEHSHAWGISWNRIETAIETAKSGKYDWVYVVGADTLITNMTIPLTSLIDDAYHFIISNDCNEWNADSMLWRCSPEGIAFMDDVLSQYERLKHHVWVEQQAMIEVRGRHPICKTLPQRAMNSYEYSLYPNRGPRDGKDCAGNDGQWQPGDFLIHWAGLNSHVRKEQIEKVMPQVVR